MVTQASPGDRAAWTEDHFVGGHPILDLTNTVFSRSEPIADRELLATSMDVVTWCVAAGVMNDEGVPLLTQQGGGLVAEVCTVRERAWAVFNAVARGEQVPAEGLGALLERAGTGVRAGHVRPADAGLGRVTADWAAPGALPDLLSLLAVRALFVLPPHRIRACGRCGWLFLDSSRGGRRRWCSMTICGNRAKAARHRQQDRAPADPVPFDPSAARGS